MNRLNTSRKNEGIITSILKQYTWPNGRCAVGHLHSIQSRYSRKDYLRKQANQVPRQLGRFQDRELLLKLDRGVILLCREYLQGLSANIFDFRPIYIKEVRRRAAMVNKRENM